MMYLEQKGLVHRDLAARNILVTAHNQVGLSIYFDPLADLRGGATKVVALPSLS